MYLLCGILQMFPLLPKNVAKNSRRYILIGDNFLQTMEELNLSF